MTKTDYNKYLTESFKYLRLQQEICDELYNLSDFEQYCHFPDTDVMEFSGGIASDLITRYQIVGSVSKPEDIWMWSWENAFLPRELKAQMEVVKQFGEQNKIAKIQRSYWQATEELAWEMTALASFCLRAKGSYRLQIDEDTTLFLVFTDLRFAKRA